MGEVRDSAPHTAPCLKDWQEKLAAVAKCRRRVLMLYPRDATMGGVAGHVLPPPGAKLFPRGNGGRCARLHGMAGENFRSRVLSLYPCHGWHCSALFCANPFPAAIEAEAVGGVKRMQRPGPRASVKIWVMRQWTP